MIRRLVVALAAMAALVPAAGATAGPVEDPAGLVLTIEAPETYSAATPITVSGYLYAFAKAPVAVEVSRGVVNAPVEVFVDDVRVAEATTDIQGHYLVELTFGPEPPTTREIHAVAFGRVALLATSSERVQTRLARILLELEIVPASISVAPGQTERLTAMGLFDDGRTQDVSEQAMWSSSDTAVATVSNASGDRGVVTGVAPGTATINAVLDTIVAHASVTVSG